MGETMEMVYSGRSQAQKVHTDKTIQSGGKIINIGNICKKITMCSCFRRQTSIDRKDRPKQQNLQNWELTPEILTGKSGLKEDTNSEGNKLKEKTVKPPRPALRECDACYKILMIGDSGVGKTAILRNLQGQNFSSKSFTTVGMDFVKKTLEVDGAKVKLEIWDTAGQERFRSMTRFQFRGAKGAILVYDVTDRDSYKTLHYWLKLIDMEIDQYNKEPIPVLLLGNKADMTEQRQVPYKKGLQISDEYLMHGFRETSAKTGRNILEAITSFTHAVTEINNPKLLDSYLDKYERTEKYEQREQEAQEIQNLQQKKRRSRIRLKSISRRKSVDTFRTCFK